MEEMRQRWITLTGNGWHDVICGLIREGQLEQALEGLEEVRRAGHQIQAWLSDMTIYALCSTEELDEALNVMQDRVAAGEVNISSSTWYYLFDMGCKLLHVSHALPVGPTISHKTSMTFYNIYGALVSEWTT